MKKLILLSLSVVLFLSCDYITHFNKTGDVITKEIEWNGAPHIEIYAPVRIIPVIDSVCRMEITGMDFLVEDYVFIQSDEKLMIEHKKSYRLQEEKIADLILYAPKYERFTANSPCKFESRDTLFFNNLTFVINGRGSHTTGNLILKGNSVRISAYSPTNRCKLTVSGEVNWAFYSTEGVTLIDAFGLSTVNTKILHKSAGNYNVSVSGLLDVEIYSTGNVYYKGNPTVDLKRIENFMMKATGQVINVN